MDEIEEKKNKTKQKVKIIIINVECVLCFPLIYHQLLCRIFMSQVDQ